MIRKVIGPLSLVLLAALGLIQHGITHHGVDPSYTEPVAAGFLMSSFLFCLSTSGRRGFVLEYGILFLVLTVAMIHGVFGHQIGWFWTIPAGASFWLAVSCLTHPYQEYRDE